MPRYYLLGATLLSLLITAWAVTHAHSAKDHPISRSARMSGKPGDLLSRDEAWHWRSCQPTHWRACLLQN